MAINQGPAVVVGAVAVTVAIVLLKLQAAASGPPPWPCRTDGTEGYDPWLHRCLKLPNCPIGTLYNACSRTCEVPVGGTLAPPIIDCGLGAVYDPCFHNCVSATPCPWPYSYLYDPITRLCQSPPAPARLRGSIAPVGFRGLV